MTFFGFVQICTKVAPMKTRLTEPQIEQIAQYLRNTNYLIDAACEQLGLTYADLDGTSIQTIDTMIFCCESCGYWFDLKEYADDELCWPCAETHSRRILAEELEQNYYDEEQTCD